MFFFRENIWNHISGSRRDHPNQTMILMDGCTKYQDTRFTRKNILIDRIVYMRIKNYNYELLTNLQILIHEKQNLFNVICSFKVVNLIIKKYNDNFLNDVYWTFLEALLWPLGWLPWWLQQVWRLPQTKIRRQQVLGHGQVLWCLLQVCGGGKAKAMSEQELNVVRFQTVFVNNPMCGLMMLVAIFIGHWKAGVGCVVGGKWWKM